MAGLWPVLDEGTMALSGVLHSRPTRRVAATPVRPEKPFCVRGPPSATSTRRTETSSLRRDQR
jgi:hypothetical protein